MFPEGNLSKNILADTVGSTPIVKQGRKATGLTSFEKIAGLLRSKAVRLFLFDTLFRVKGIYEE